MTRKFNIGRHNEVLMNNEHYNIYKSLQYYLNHPDNLDRGPVATSVDKDILNGALWLDKYSDSTSADLKFFDNGKWNLLFENKFKLLAHLLDSEEPTNPIEGMLWINGNGALCYYHNGQFQVVKAYQTSDDEESSLQYEDFLIINPLKSAEYAVINNFTKFLFANTPIKEWEPNKKYYYQQGVIVNHTLYVCNKEHWSTAETHPTVNGYYWSRLDTLIQFLVPNTNYDKVFINGLYVHEKQNELYDEIEQQLYKTFALTFDYEDDDVLHDSLRFDIPGDAGFYDTASLAIEGSEEDNNPDLVLPSNKIKEEEGYIKNTNVSIYLPIDSVELDEGEINEYETGENKRLITGVHANPVKLNKINKYFIKLDKKSLVVPIPKENTEYYGIGSRYEYTYEYKNVPSETKMYDHKLTTSEINKIIALRESDVENNRYTEDHLITKIEYKTEYKGIGMLLMESTDDYTYDYCSYMSNGVECIKINKKLIDKYDYIYAVHYEFSNSVKVKGTLDKKRIKLNDQQSIYIGKTNPNNLAVFAQGLYYQKSENTYEYNSEDGYIYLKEKLMAEGSDKRLELSVVKFPTIHQGKITADRYNANNFVEGRGYRVDLNSILYEPTHCLGFISGMQINPQEDFSYYEDDLTAIYFKNMTLDFVNKNGGSVTWIIAETDKVENGVNTYQMFRGKTKAINIGNGVGVKLTRDKNFSKEDTLYLDYLEVPILFVDGLIMTQADISLEEDYLTLKNLTVGQEVVMLADTSKAYSLEDIIEKTEVITNVKKHSPEEALEDYDNGKKVIEDIRYANEYAEKINSYVYENHQYIHSICNFDKLLTTNSDSLLFQDNAAYITIQTDKNDSVLLYLRNGLICDTNAVEVTSIPTSGYDGEIKHLVNTFQDRWLKYNMSIGLWEVLSDEEIKIISENSNGYFSTGNSISILNDLNGQKYCTYMAYKYSDTIEKTLLTGYCVPNGSAGTKDGLLPYELNYKHYYCPGRNELNVYVNGVKQNLSSPYDSDYEKSFVKECDLNDNNSFMLSIDNNSTNGQALTEYEGYYTYKVIENNSTSFIYSHEKLTDEELNKHESIELVSTPNKNVIFYVVEPTESNETGACTKYVLTYKNSLSSKGGFADNTYQCENLNLSNGNIRVFINGLRQPYGTFKDLENNAYCSYKIINSNTIQIQDPLIGGSGGNQGDIDNPKFPINISNPTSGYYELIDEILIEKRRDYSLREMTIPLKPGKTEFTIEDQLPSDLFKTKDTIMIYINGFAYGNEYTNKYGTISLDNVEIQKYINNDNFNVITFEWR